MTAEEAIIIIEGAAHQYSALDADIFTLRVREDLSLFRQQRESPQFEHRPIERDVEYPSSKPEFSIPERYSNNAELWVVFSAFVSCFLDPIDFGVHALRTFQASAAGTELERVAIVSENRPENDPEEIEFLDLDHLLQDRAQLQMLAAEIGRGLFGDQFNVSDFVAPGGLQ
jgi:hypothetical protein